jgi:hypothetical protein
MRGSSAVVIFLIPIDQVKNGQYLEAFVKTRESIDAFLNGETSDLVRMEVYTGYITIEWYGTPHQDREATIYSYLPTEGRTIRDYASPESVFKHTVVVTVSSDRDDDDESNLVGIKDVEVLLDKQESLSGDPVCLLLRATLAVHASLIYSIAYQVTLLSAVETSTRQFPPNVERPPGTPPVEVPIDLKEIELSEGDSPSEPKPKD